MSEINFYHIKNTSTENALIMLLQKTISADKKAILRCYNDTHIEHYDQALWTAQKESFLPHGTAHDDLNHKHPIYITAEDDNPNNADFLFITSFAPKSGLDLFERIFILFEDNDPEAVTWARTFWKEIKDTDHTPTYWIQNDVGKWEKKG